MTVSVPKWGVAVALAVGWAALGAAQGPPALAIVGARIVDGSGNEPFVGTLIVEAGRIKAVGRLLEVPAGTTKVDAAGRTLLPGLVDVLVSLEGKTAEQRAAAVAAALYAGVTSAAVVGVPLDRLDALRAGSGLPDTGPRVTAVGTLDASPATTGAPLDWSRVLRSGVQAILVAADGAGVEAVAADARSRGLRLIVDAHSGGGAGAVALTPHLVLGSGGLTDAAALVAQNVTVAPDLLAAAPARLLGDAPAPVDLSAQTAPRPATDAAAPDDVARWDGSVASLKTLRDARVRTAVASRVGSRLPPGQATHAAVRLLVEAGLTPLQAVTAATSGGAWALGVQSDRGFLAPGMRADLVLVQGDPTTTIADLGRVDRVFLNGTEVDRAALLTKARAADAAPPAPEPARPTRLETEITEAPAATKPPATRAARRRRGAIEPKVPDAPKPAETSASEAPAPVTPPLPAASPESAAAAPAAPRPPEVETAVKPAAPARLRSALIDDFEREDRSAAGPDWSSASSEGPTPATIVVGRVVRGLRDHALHLTARMGEGKAPFARVSIPLTDGGLPVDASRFRGLRFDARGEGRYRIVFVTRAIVDGRYHESYFSGSPLWTPVGIPFASIGQNGKGTHDSFTGADLVEIRFEVARDPGRMGWLELDNVTFY